jgi:hypothetical protein
MYLATSWTMYRKLVAFLDSYFGEFLVKESLNLWTGYFKKKIGDNAKCCTQKKEGLDQYWIHDALMSQQFLSCKEFDNLLLH